MKFTLIGAGTAAIALIVTAAVANEEFIQGCEAYASENDADIDCACLNEAAEEDPSLYEEFAQVSKPEDAENMSDDAKAVVAQCSAD